MLLESFSLGLVRTLHVVRVIFIRASENSMCCMLPQVSKRPVALLGSVTTNEPVINSPVQLSFRLVDTITNQQITDIQWRVGIVSD